MRHHVVTAALVCAGVLWSAGAARGLDSSGSAQELNADPARTVWDGVFTKEQAGRGRERFMQTCAQCHGEDLRGESTAPSLVEESFAFLFDDITVGELVRRIRTLMPPERPNSLPAQDYSDIVAFLLQSNQFPFGGTALDADPDALDKIRIAKVRP